MRNEISVFDVGGITGDAPLVLNGAGVVQFEALDKAVEVDVTLIEDKQLGHCFSGQVLAVSQRKLKLAVQYSCAAFSDLRLRIQGQDQLPDIYGKIIGVESGEDFFVVVHVTSIIDDLQQFLAALRRG